MYKDGERQPNDGRVPSFQDPTWKFGNEIKSVLKRRLPEGRILADEYRFMFQDNPEKICHKEVTCPPGRPVVSGNRSLSQSHILKALPTF